jgi:GT2 family glycosyltransferase
MKNVSIIIISYNRPDDTLDLLKDITLFNNLAILEKVIVLNNSSTVDYTEVTNFISENIHIPFHLIDAPENLGVSRGRNYATKFANGDILFYVDDDVNLKDKNTLQKLLTAFDGDKRNDRKLGVVSFKVLHTSNMQMQVNALPHKKFDTHKDLHEFLTYYYAGCAHAKLRQAWIDAGPYPENFFYGMEEYDFSFRVLDKNYYIKYDDSLLVLHKESPLGRNTKAEKLRMMWVNKTKVAWRYLPKKYFYSTFFLWGLFFLVKSRFNFQNFIKGLKEAINIPSSEKRNPLSKETLNYFKDVDARLWY